MGGVGMERGHIHGNYEMPIQQVQEVRWSWTLASWILEG
jgi:hypothetical protein